MPPLAAEDRAHRLFAAGSNRWLAAAAMLRRSRNFDPSGIAITQTPHPRSNERLALSHISRVFRRAAPWARLWRRPAKPPADCLLVFAPVVGQHSLVGAERRPVSGSFLNVAAEAF